MQGSQKVIDLLNKQLTLELTSMDQYLAHGKMFDVIKEACDARF